MLPESSFQLVSKLLGDPFARCMEKGTHVCLVGWLIDAFYSSPLRQGGWSLFGVFGSLSAIKSLTQRPQTNSVQHRAKTELLITPVSISLLLISK